MSSSKSSAKPRIQRLRASCDGCFLAKVKCSKARPICSRCLTCGTDCKYSPSSRAGKPKANKTNTTQNMSVNIVNPDIMADSALSSPFFFDSNAITISADSKNTHIFTFDSNWSATSGSTEDSFPGSLSATTSPPENIPILDTDFSLPTSTSETFNPSFAWMQSGGIDEHELFQLEPAMMLARSRSVGDVPQLSTFSPWIEGQQNVHFSPHISNTSSSPNAFDSPRSSPEFAGSSRTPASPCSCLKTCLQSLLALHDHSNPAKTQPAFDVVLTINQKAVEGCASMLACSNCALRSGSNTNAMLLATIMEKILSFYQEAAQDYSGSTPGTDSHMSIGAYQVTNEDESWIKPQILWRELCKLHELLEHFREVCGGRGGLEDTGMHSSLVNHLSQSLSFTFEMMKLQQSGFGRLQ